MAEAQLIKSVMIVPRFDNSGDPHFKTGVPFVQFDEDTHLPCFSAVLTLDKWMEFGRPDTITVTVEPGDLLNVDHRAPTMTSQSIYISDEL